MSVRTSDLCELAERIPAVAEALRLEQLEQRGDYRGKILPEFKRQRVGLSTHVVGGIAKVVKILGLTYQSDTDHLSHVISDIVQGWALDVEGRDSDKWQEAANHFAYNMCRNPGLLPSLKDQELVKMAFLQGVRMGLGDFNVRHTPERLRLMQQRLKARGLGNPAKILMDQLDGAKIQLRLFEKQQERLLQSGPRLAIGTSASSDNDIDMDGEDITGESDDLFEFDEAGMVA